MVKLFVVLALMLTVMAQVHAVEMVTLQRASGATIATVDDASFEKVWVSNTPACIKRRGSVLKVNAAYSAKGFKSSECSNTPAALKEQKLLGYTVAVFKLQELSEKYAKQAMGIK